MTRRAGWSSAVAVACLAAPCARAGNEVCEDKYPDAGPLPGTALIPLGMGTIGAINGRTAVAAGLIGVPVDLEDMYLVQVLNPLEFQAMTVAPLEPPIFNTSLWLFDPCGLGLVANLQLPNSPPDSLFALLLPFPNDGVGPGVTKIGPYFLAITGDPHFPASEKGPIFQFQQPFEISGPDGPGGGLPVQDWVQFAQMGAYRIELNGVGFVGIQSPPCGGDLNQSGGVEGGDLGLMLSQWGPCMPGTLCNADLDGNQVVDGGDLGALLAGWGPCAPQVGSPCGHPDAGDCFVIHDTPGCADPCCCTLVCQFMPACCEAEWDTFCREAAQQVCPNPT